MFQPWFEKMIMFHSLFNICEMSLDHNAFTLNEHICCWMKSQSLSIVMGDSYKHMMCPIGFKYEFEKVIIFQVLFNNCEMPLTQHALALDQNRSSILNMQYFSAKMQVVYVDSDFLQWLIISHSCSTFHCFSGNR